MAKKNLKSIVDYDFDQNDVVYEDESVESKEAETSAADMLPEVLIEKTPVLEKHPAYAENATLGEHPGYAKNAKVKVNPYWEKRNWAGVKDVFMCKMCGEYRESKDDMIMHVVSHYPEDQKNQIFDQLVRE